MTDSTHRAPELLECAVDVRPDSVDAGAPVTLRCAVSSATARDLRGRTVLIKDHNRATIHHAELTEFVGGTNSTNEFRVRAPFRPGAYTWSAVVPGEETVDEATFALEVKPHTVSISVWGVPSAIPIGETFTINVGIGCSSQCALTNHEVRVFDHEGRLWAGAPVGGTPWADTEALYFGEVTHRAPETVGLFEWVVRVEDAALETADHGEALPHSAASARFGVRFVPRPQHVVTVEVVDRHQKTPLVGAGVVMHPYRTSTDERGVAVVRVTGGQYKIFVSQTGYLTACLPIDITDDFATRAELDLEPVIEPD